MRQLCAMGGHTALQHYSKEYERLGIDYKEKSILNLEVDLWNPFKINAEVEIRYFTDETPEGITLENIVVNRPYPNKNIVSASMKYGKKISKAGVQIVLDNMDELHKINRILIAWKIFSFAPYSEFVIADYLVKFANPVEDGIYSVWSYERLLRNESKKEMTELFNGIGNIYSDFMYLEVDTQTEYENIAELYKIQSVLQSYKATLPFAISYYIADAEITDNVVCFNELF